MLRLFFLPLIACLILAACGRDDSSRRRVVTATTPPQQWLLQQIAGDRVEVQTLLKPGANPETFEPDMRTLSGLQNSLLLFTTNAPGFEQTLTQTMSTNFPDVKVVNTTTDIELLHGTHHHHAAGLDEHHHDDADDADPHVWTSLRNARIMAAAMLKALKNADPEGADVYEKNYLALDQRLEALDDSITRVLAPQHGRSFLVWHPSLAYFAHDYHLSQIAVETDGKELTPSAMRHRMDAMAYGQPLVFFLQTGYDSQQARSIAAESGLPMTEISPMAPDIIDQARKVTRALTR